MELLDEKDILNYFLWHIDTVGAKINILDIQKKIGSPIGIKFFEIIIDNFSTNQIIKLNEEGNEAIIVDAAAFKERISFFLSGPKEPQIEKKERILLGEIKEPKARKTIEEKTTPSQRTDTEREKLLLKPIKINGEKMPIIISYPPSFHGRIKKLINKYPNLPIYTFGKFVRYAFQTAKEEILICNPFIDFNGVGSIFNEIIETIEKNIRLKILTRDIVKRNTYTFNNKNSDKIRGLLKILEVFKSDNKLNLVEIRDFGVRFLISSPYSKHYEGIHQKLIITDEKLCYLGSGEIRDGTLLNNADLGCVITNVEEIRFYKEFYNLFWDAEESIPIKYENLKSFIIE